MPPRVNIPEKTLEHWASIYITYRFRSKASQWWPVSGQDIDIRNFPSLPGKSVQLEVKTVRPPSRRSSSHDVHINLGQLWDYSARPLHLQPFYAFPWPHWSGPLERAAWASGIPPTELAFSRSSSNTISSAAPMHGSPAWFAEWMVVMTTREVGAVLAAELAAHGNGNRKNADRRLVRFTTGVNPGAQWGTSANPSQWAPTYYRWRDFWDELTNCGREAWPQLFRVEPQDVQGGPTYPREALRRALANKPRTESGRLHRENFQNLVTVGPNANGELVLVPDPMVWSSEDDEEVDTSRERFATQDSRVAVFLDASSINA